MVTTILSDRGRRFKMCENYDTSSRTHDMAGRATFLIPVVIDDPNDREAEVPDEFRSVQWTRIHNGETPVAFVERVRGLLQSKGVRIDSTRSVSIPSAAPAPVAPSREPPASAPIVLKAPVKLSPALLAAIVVAALAVGYIGLSQFKSRQPAVVATVTAPLSAPTNAAEKSVAVLSFVNESSDKEQEYFADGLTETMIDLLSKVPDLHVAARTSSSTSKTRTRGCGYRQGTQCCQRAGGLCAQGREQAADHGAACPSRQRLSAVVRDLRPGY